MYRLLPKISTVFCETSGSRPSRVWGWRHIFTSLIYHLRAWCVSLPLIDESDADTLPWLLAVLERYYFENFYPYLSDRSKCLAASLLYYLKNNFVKSKWKICWWLSFEICSEFGGGYTYGAKFLSQHQLFTQVSLLLQLYYNMINYLTNRSTNLNSAAICWDYVEL